MGNAERKRRGSRVKLRLRGRSQMIGCVKRKSREQRARKEMRRLHREEKKQRGYCVEKEAEEREGFCEFVVNVNLAKTETGR